MPETAHIAIVALGPKPLRKYAKKEGGGEPVMLLPEPFETPPARLFRRGRAESGNGDWIAVPLPFNRPVSMWKVSAGKGILLYRRIPGDDDFRAYARIPGVEPGGRMIFFFLPSAKGAKPWNPSPRLVSLDLGSAEHRDRNFILYNLSDHPVLHAFDHSLAKVEPGRIIAYRRPMGDRLHRVAASCGPSRQIIYNSAVRIDEVGSILLHVLYNANPATNSGREVGVFRMVVPAAGTVPQPEGPIWK